MSGRDNKDGTVRSTMQILVDPTFGLFFGGRLASTSGMWMYNIVAAILAYELSGSALVVGLVSFAQFGPQLLLSPLSGALADRGDRLRLIILGRFFIAIGSGALAVWIWIASVEGLPGAWPIALSSAVLGLGIVIAVPAQNALIPALVRPGELTSAITLNAVPGTIGRAAGPAIGALIIVWVGSATTFAITAATSLLFALMLMLMPLDVGRRPDGGSGVRDRRVRAGIKYLKEDRGIVLLLGGVVATSLGADPVITLGPSFAANFGQGASLVGAFASSFGVGTAVGFALVGVLRRWVGLPHMATTGLSMVALGIAFAAVSDTPVTVAMSLAGSGAGMTLSLIGLTTELQARLPDVLRGRVMALWSVAWLGSRPLAAVMNGAIADATSTTTALLFVAAVVAIVTWFSRPSALAARQSPRIMST